MNLLKLQRANFDFDDTTDYLSFDSDFYQPLTKDQKTKNETKLEKFFRNLNVETPLDRKLLLGVSVT